MHPASRDNSAPAVGASIEGLLDQIFDAALSAFEDGNRPTVEDFITLDTRGYSQQIADTIELAREAASLSSGDFPHVPGYTLLGELGRGGMGRVYLASQDRLNGRRVALNILGDDAGWMPGAVRRFREEIAAVARLDHPNIIRIFEAPEGATSPTLAMELVTGCSLGELIQELVESGKPADMKQVRLSLRSVDNNPQDSSYELFIARLGIEIAWALDSVHRMKLLHRDVKPSNILLRRDGTPLLSDFGLVRNTEQLAVTQVGHFIGTPSYAAPEQLRGDHATAEFRSDIYSLGATLYHALTLRRPHTCTSITDALATIERGITPPRQINKSIPRDLETIILKAMHPAPERRYDSAAGLAEDLRRFLLVRPIQAKPIGLPEVLVKWLRRNRLSLFVGTSVFAATMMLSGVALVNSSLGPRWSLEALSRAREEFVSPQHGNQLYQTEFFGVRSRSFAIPDIAPLSAAATYYTTAQRWGGNLDDCGAELAVVECLLRWRQGLPANICLRSVGALPATRRYLENVITGQIVDQSVTTGVAGFTFETVQPGSESDTRALAFAAWIGLDTPMAISAWTSLNTIRPDDPYVQVILGMLYVTQEKYALAYPRLQSSRGQFPNSGFVRQFAAEAALGCGDTSRARQFLEESRRLPNSDRFADFRLESMAQLQEGRRSEVIAKLLPEHFPVESELRTTVFYYFMARELCRDGVTELGVGVASRSLGSPSGRRACHLAVPYLRGWWSQLTLDERVAEVIREFVRSPKVEPEFRMQVLEHYCVALRELAGFDDPILQQSDITLDVASDAILGESIDACVARLLHFGKPTPAPQDLWRRKDAVATLDTEFVNAMYRADSAGREALARLLVTGH